MAAPPKAIHHLPPAATITSMLLMVEWARLDEVEAVTSIAKRLTKPENTYSPVDLASLAVAYAEALGQQELDAADWDRYRPDAMAPTGPTLVEVDLIAAAEAYGSGDGRFARATVEQAMRVYGAIHLVAAAARVLREAVRFLFPDRPLDRSLDIAATAIVSQLDIVNYAIEGGNENE